MELQCNCLICRTGNRNLAGDYLAKFELSIVFKKLKCKIKNLEYPILITHCENLNIKPIDESHEVKIQIHNPTNLLADKLDFSSYNFDIDNPSSIIDYVQKIQLKLYLLQSEITLKEMNAYINGQLEIAPTISVINQKRFLDMLNECSSLKVMSDEFLAMRIFKNVNTENFKNK